MHPGQDPQDLQDHRPHEGLPDPRVGRRGNLRGERLSTTNQVEIEIPASAAYVGVVRLALASLARTAGFGEEAVDDLKIAVSEACANAVLAHEEAGSDDPVTVSWAQAGERVTVEVGDRGRSQDQPDSAFDSQGFSSRAVLSGALLQSLADEVEYLPREGGGTHTRITFSRS